MGEDQLVRGKGRTEARKKTTEKERKRKWRKKRWKGENEERQRMEPSRRQERARGTSEKSDTWLE